MFTYQVQRREDDEWITVMQSDFEDTQQFTLVAQCDRYRIVKDNKDITRKFKTPLSIQRTTEWQNNAKHSEIERQVNTRNSAAISNHVCIAGNLKMKRTDLIALLNRAGFVVKEDVTSKTQYLITNFVNGSTGNHVRARKLQTKILTEQEAVAICNEKLNVNADSSSTSTVRRRSLLGGHI